MWIAKVLLFYNLNLKINVSFSFLVKFLGTMIYTSLISFFSALSFANGLVFYKSCNECASSAGCTALPPSFTGDDFYKPCYDQIKDYSSYENSTLAGYRYLCDYGTCQEVMYTFFQKEDDIGQAYQLDQNSDPYNNCYKCMESAFVSPAPAQCVLTPPGGDPPYDNDCVYGFPRQWAGSWDTMAFEESQHNTAFLGKTVHCDLSCEGLGYSNYIEKMVDPDDSSIHLDLFE